MRLSVRRKITVWYTLFLILLVSCFLLALAYYGKLRAGDTARAKLMEVVLDTSDEIEKSGEDFVFDHEFKLYTDGVYISVYTEEGELLKGKFPPALDNLPELTNMELVKMQDGDRETWYVYDCAFKVDGESIWVRGMVKDFTRDNATYDMLKAAWLVFPLLILIASVGGVLITGKVFAPLKKMNETAAEIAKSDDLSKRIEIGEGEGEIHELSKTFNLMFAALEKSFAQEKQFTSDVSHELRTPLAVLISESEYALSDPEYQQAALEIVNREAKRMNALVSRLLMLSKSEAGRLSLNRESLDFGELCRQVCQQQAQLYEYDPALFYWDIREGILVYADEVMVMRILMNLLDNARHYGKPPISLRVYGDEEYAYGEVKDSGEGIAPEHLEKIWHRFYRVEQSRAKEGSGLGLAIARSLARAHEGDLLVESKVRFGSMFTLKLPREKN